MVRRAEGPLQRVKDDEQLHDVLGGRRAGRLYEEHVSAANALLNPHPDLTIGKAPDLHLRQRDAKMMGDCLTELWIGVAAQDTKIV